MGHESNRQWQKIATKYTKPTGSITKTQNYQHPSFSVNTSEQIYYSPDSSSPLVITPRPECQEETILSTAIAFRLQLGGPRTRALSRSSATLLRRARGLLTKVTPIGLAPPDFETVAGYQFRSCSKQDDPPVGHDTSAAHVVDAEFALGVVVGDCGVRGCGGEDAALSAVCVSHCEAPGVRAAVTLGLACGDHRSVVDDPGSAGLANAQEQAFEAPFVAVAA